MVEIEASTIRQNFRDMQIYPNLKYFTYDNNTKKYTVKKDAIINYMIELKGLIDINNPDLDPDDFALSFQFLEYIIQLVVNEDFKLSDYLFINDNDSTMHFNPLINIYNNSRTWKIPDCNKFILECILSMNVMPEVKAIPPTTGTLSPVPWARPGDPPLVMTFPGTAKSGSKSNLLGDSTLNQNLNNIPKWTKCKDYISKSNYWDNIISDIKNAPPIIILTILIILKFKIVENKCGNYDKFFQEFEDVDSWMKS